MVMARLRLFPGGHDSAAGLIGSMANAKGTRVPIPDPIPSPRRSLLIRFKRIMRLMTLLSIVIAAIAVILVARGDSGTHINMLIATGLGVGLTVQLGTALMTLMFLSADSGHDEQASRYEENDDL
jgi:hypothetical protein